MVVVTTYCTNPIMVEGLRVIIEGIADFSLSPAYSDMGALIRDARMRHPDILLLEVDDAVTLELLGQIALWMPSTHIMLRVGPATTEFVSQALQLGVRGILRSTSSVKNHAECLTEVGNGRVWVEIGVSQDPERPSQVALTRRESEIIGLVSQGLSNQEIAWSLVVTEVTVNAYLSRLIVKTGVSDRLELALIAWKNLAAQTSVTDGGGCASELRVVPRNTPRHLKI